MRHFFLTVLMIGTSACLTRAPTSYELDVRSGMQPPNQKEKSIADDLPIKTSSVVARAAQVPVKVPPVIEKVWVSDLALSPTSRMQGTWMFLEVEPGRWLDEVDPGGASLLKLKESKK